MIRVASLLHTICFSAKRILASLLVSSPWFVVHEADSFEKAKRILQDYIKTIEKLAELKP